jgi:hypothetical protein
MSDPRKGESNPAKHESCPIQAKFRERMRVAMRSSPLLRSGARSGEAIHRRVSTLALIIRIATISQTRWPGRLRSPVGAPGNITVTLLP